MKITTNWKVNLRIMALDLLTTRLTAFTFYRLQSGEYTGWRIRDVWRQAPDALVAASMATATAPRDARMIALFLTLFGGLTYRPTDANADGDGADMGVLAAAAPASAATLPITTPAFGLMADLPGQTTVQTRLTVALHTARARGDGVVVVCFSLDHHDALARQVGEFGVEEVTAQLGARLRMQVPDPASAGRLGYGVFVALLPLPHAQSAPRPQLLADAQQRADVLHAALAVPVTVSAIPTSLSSPPSLTSLTVGETVRVAVALRMGLAVAPVQGMDAASLLLLASQAMAASSR